MIEILLMLLLLLVAYRIDAPILRLFKVNCSSTEMGFLLSVGLGFGIIAYTVFFLGIIGLLYTKTAYILLGTLLITAFPNTKRILIGLLRNRSKILV